MIWEPVFFIWTKLLVCDWIILSYWRYLPPHLGIVQNWHFNPHCTEPYRDELGFSWKIFVIYVINYPSPKVNWVSKHRLGLRVQIGAPTPRKLSIPVNWEVKCNFAISCGSHCRQDLGPWFFYIYWSFDWWMEFVVNSRNVKIYQGRAHQFGPKFAKINVLTVNWPWVRG